MNKEDRKVAIEVALKVMGWYAAPAYGKDTYSRTPPMENGACEHPLRYIGDNDHLHVRFNPAGDMRSAMEVFVRMATCGRFVSLIFIGRTDAAKWAVEYRDEPGMAVKQVVGPTPQSAICQAALATVRAKPMREATA